MKKLKTCSKCLQEKEKDGFPKVGLICSSCKAEYTRRWRKKNPKKSQCLHYRRNFNITLEEYNRMLSLQNNCCAICGIHETSAPRQKLFVDHCHRTGKVRELLCSWCNIAIGNLREDPTIIYKAIEYVEKHNENTEKAFYKNLDKLGEGS